MMKGRIILLGILCLGGLFLSFTEPPEKREVFTVVLDAGHGGHDPGNIGNGFREKDIALKIILEVGKLLEGQKDIKVVYTRKTDKFVDLYVRGKIANDAKANLFVSVHCNSHNSEAHGTETFVLGLHANKQNFEVAKKENSVIYLEDNHEVNYAGYDINSPESVIGLTMLQEEFLDQSILLAKYIQDSFTNKLYRKDRGVKQAGFIVLHQTFMPSVLVETGFLTYLEEGRYLNSQTGQNSMAKSIAESVIKYKNIISENTGDDISMIDTDTVLTSGEVEIPKSSETPKLSPDIRFKIQIAAGASDIETKAYNFKGLTPVSKEKFNKIFRYLYGDTNSYEIAQNLQKEAIAKGYPSAFIVAYKKDVRITVEEALKSGSN